MANNTKRSLTYVYTTSIVSKKNWYHKQISSTVNVKPAVHKTKIFHTARKKFANGMRCNKTIFHPPHLLLLFFVGAIVSIYDEENHTSTVYFVNFIKQQCRVVVANGVQTQFNRTPHTTYTLQPHVVLSSYTG